jgi:prepilin peptidase CpaA
MLTDTSSFYFAALLTTALACVTDLRVRRIPNLLTLGSAGIAVAAHLIWRGWPAAGSSLAGWALALALLLPFFAVRGIGGGDVKLLAALGAWLGPADTLMLALWSSLAGGVMALVVAAAHGYLKQAFVNVWSLLLYWRIAGFTPHPALTLETSGGRPRLPFSVPIAGGLMVTLWLV